MLAPLASNDALVLDNVTREFGALRAVDGVSLTIAAGKTKTITFKLSGKARETVRKKKSTKVTLAIDLGAGGKATKNLKLKR